MSRTTSELGHYVREYARELGGHKPLSAGASRYGVANNLNHLQDEMTQQPVNMAYPASGTFSGRAYYEVAAPVDGTYKQLGSMPPAPVFLRFQSDGSSSRIVVKLRAYSTAGKAVLFRAILRKLSVGIAPGITPLAPYPPSAGGPEVADLTTSSATPVTLTATLYISRLTDAFLKFFPAVDGAGGVSNVRTYMAQVEIWASSADPLWIPRVEALSCREWIGA
jgi:hypothetical protein